MFYLIYELLLKRETWFKFNRFYLLFGVFFSLVLPFIDFSAAKFVVNSENQFQYNEFMGIGGMIKFYENKPSFNFRGIDFFLLTYLVISTLFFVLFILRIIKLFKLGNAYEIIKYKNYNLIILDKTTSPFSFFNYIFINKDDYRHVESNKLLLHEIIHVKQKHSLDIIILELVLVLQWFNPFMYRYRLACKEIHEYLADNAVLQRNTDKLSYQKLIITQIEKNIHVNLASHFNYSLTKKRIKMMTRINSGRLSRFKILFTIPLVALLLLMFSFETPDKPTENKKGASLLSFKNNQKPSLFPVKRVEGVKISSGFGIRVHPISKQKKMHNAVDIKAPKGTEVYATADGMIRKVKNEYTKGKGYGKYIIIDHANGYSTLYSQLSVCKVKEGNEVKKGDVIGLVGSSGLSTGPHLHYEIKKDGEFVNPEKYF